MVGRELMAGGGDMVVVVVLPAAGDAGLGSTRLLS